MKGFSKLVGIVFTLIIAVIILVVVVPFITKAGDAGNSGVSDSQLTNCCDNCCNRDPLVPINEVKCTIDKTIGELAEETGRSITTCEQISFCKCS